MNNRKKGIFCRGFVMWKRQSKLCNPGKNARMLGQRQTFELAKKMGKMCLLQNFLHSLAFSCRPFFVTHFFLRIFVRKISNKKFGQKALFSKIYFFLRSINNFLIDFYLRKFFARIFTCANFVCFHEFAQSFVKARILCTNCARKLTIRK